MNVMALTPLIGKFTMHCELSNVVEYTLNSSPADMYIDLLEKAISSRNTSIRLFSISLVTFIGVLQPTPVCHIEYVTFVLDLSLMGNVKPV